MVYRECGRLEEHAGHRRGRVLDQPALDGDALEGVPVARRAVEIPVLREENVRFASVAVAVVYEDLCKSFQFQEEQWISAPLT